MSQGKAKSETIDLDTWEQFEPKIQELQGSRENTEEAQFGSFSDLLFRGQGYHSWDLETTLDRSRKNPWSFYDYFRLISIARAQIETFTKLRWDIDDLPKLQKWASMYGNLGVDPFPGYDYLVFLRHHGFPSPLLDWTRSPYIAAFFAFDQPRSERVAVYVYREYAGHGKVGSSDKPRIVKFGPYVRSHSRHFLQQSEYTISAQFQNDEWWYVPHMDAFRSSPKIQDQLWKITMPATEQSKVLKMLDAYNLNMFSLFQTDEALLRTIAVREIKLRG